MRTAQHSKPLQALAVFVVSIPSSWVPPQPPTEVAAPLAALAPAATTDVEPHAATQPVAPQPDAVAGFVGGAAARVRTGAGTALPGHVFVLMATPGSTAKARVYDATPFTHTRGFHDDSHRSNVQARRTVEGIIGEDLDQLLLTTSSGGGSSGGIAYAITYLNVVSDGAFTGDVRVAATGALGRNGYVDPISAIDEKTAAAHLAGVDVIFTPSVPSASTIDAFVERRVDHLFRARNTGTTLLEERRWVDYQRWGAQQPDGMDLVGIRHIGDVAAYLCGTGSAFACDVVERLADEVVGGPAMPDRSGAPSTDDLPVGHAGLDLR